ncbi:MAG: hypothetical protein Q9166_001172 [cf. Caloplaca sp. 2 TL-2023]
MQVIVTYSLTQDHHKWLNGDAHRTIEDLTLRIGLLLQFGTEVSGSESSEASMREDAVDAVAIFANKGMLYRYLSKIISKLLELDKALVLDQAASVLFQPRMPEQMKKIEVLAKILKKGTDDMVDEACALLVHCPPHNRRGWQQRKKGL